MEQKINLKTKIIPVIVEWSENIKLWKTHSQNAERKALKYPRKNALATTKKNKTRYPRCEVENELKKIKKKNEKSDEETEKNA